MTMSFDHKQWNWPFNDYFKTIPKGSMKFPHLFPASSQGSSWQGPRLAQNKVINTQKLSSV